ncbi:gastrula zinc finger protein XlCGF8.2DB-like [Anabrus simplex]|uniref:gastrula zinc finger protein XlCGF8.2DB-like n=1 Tax=Anabrus simplex TaxID=316456 RepID=UPI0035A375A6
MALEMEIKEEPAWFEGTGNASLENVEYVSEMMPLKREAKAELTEPGPTQEISFEPSTDIKVEISMEQSTVDQLVPFIKEETQLIPGVNNADLPTPDGGAAYLRCDKCGKVLVRKLNLMRHLKRHNGFRPLKCDHCGKVFSSKSSVSENVVVPKDQVFRFLEKPYSCNICGKSFSHKVRLTVHIKTHTGEKREC